MHSVIELTKRIIYNLNLNTFEDVKLSNPLNINRLES